MKKLFVTVILVTGLLVYQKTQAQVSVHVNIGVQPAWGPVGYDYVDYYYMPDIDAYYYVPERRYIYFETNRWVFAPSLPSRLRWYDPYHGYKVVINEPKPYLRHDVYKVKYAKFKGPGRPAQIVIRDSHDNRYKNNGKGNSGDKGNGKSKGNGNGKSKGNGNGNGNGKH